ncbi:MAG: HlyD family efflux transporter periplasmic adaptor subunit [Clostridium sp.]|jgi:HlyD family secretion protein|nr:HlyD family efflux transporter periplasmic adaptor subunit [Clostridium sp.]
MSKKKKRILGASAVFLLLVLAACYTVWIAPLLEKEQWIYKEAVVEKGRFVVGVSESGSLEYGITSVLYDLDLDVSDEEDEEDDEEEVVQKYLKVEEVYVVPGQRIAQGEALLKMTDTSVSSVRRLLQNALLEAQVAYNEAQAEYELSALEAKNNYEARKIARDYASVLYQTGKTSVDHEIGILDVERNQRTANRASLEEKVTEAREAYEECLSDYEAAKKDMEAAKEGSVAVFMDLQSKYLNTGNQYQNAKAALEQATQALLENEQQIETLNDQIQTAQTRKSLDLLTQELEYQESVLNGKNAQITYEAELESLKAELQEVEDEKTQLEEKLEAFEAFVGETGILYASGSGIVTEVNCKAGDTATSAGVILAYAEPENMTISVNVTQEDVVALSVGDKVEIVFYAYEDVAHEGTIRSIDTTATSEGSVTVSYTVVIQVEGDTGELYGGMTADITFVTQEKEDVVYISRKAILEENDRTYVYVKAASGNRERREVETGISNGVYVEILSGLNEGDTIYIASKVSSTSEVEDQGDAEAASSQNVSTEGSGFLPGEGGTGQGNTPGMGFPGMSEGMPGSGNWGTGGRP